MIQAHIVILEQFNNKRRAYLDARALYKAVGIYPTYKRFIGEQIKWSELRQDIDYFYDAKHHRYYLTLCAVLAILGRLNTPECDNLIKEISDYIYTASAPTLNYEYTDLIFNIENQLEHLTAFLSLASSDGFDEMTVASQKGYFSGLLLHTEMLKENYQRLIKERPVHAMI